MAECRFFQECARCNEIGDLWFPCDGGADGTRCAAYEPMPDIDALLELADDLEKDGLEGWAVKVNVGDYAKRIREALGVES